MIKDFLEIIKAKFDKIANNVWPDIKFANNRIPKLKGLEKYEIISITIKNGNNIGLIFAVGIKVLINLLFCDFKPIIIIAIKKEKLRVKATVTWLVNVKLYKVIPNKLAIKINKNKEKIKGKYFDPFFVICCLTKLKTKEYKLIKKINIFILVKISNFIPRIKVSCFLKKKGILFPYWIFRHLGNIGLKSNLIIK